MKGIVMSSGIVVACLFKFVACGVLVQSQPAAIYNVNRNIVQSAPIQYSQQPVFYTHGSPQQVISE